MLSSFEDSINANSCSQWYGTLCLGIKVPFMMARNGNLFPEIRVFLCSITRRNTGCNRQFVNKNSIIFECKIRIVLLGENPTGKPKEGCALETSLSIPTCRVPKNSFLNRIHFSMAYSLPQKQGHFSASRPHGHPLSSGMVGEGWSMTRTRATTLAMTMRPAGEAFSRAVQKMSLNWSHHIHVLILEPVAPHCTAESALEKHLCPTPWTCHPLRGSVTPQLTYHTRSVTLLPTVMSSLELPPLHLPTCHPSPRLTTTATGQRSDWAFTHLVGFVAPDHDQNP